MVYFSDKEKSDWVICPGLILETKFFKEFEVRIDVKHSRISYGFVGEKNPGGQKNECRKADTEPQTGGCLTYIFLSGGGDYPIEAE